MSELSMKYKVVRNIHYNDKNDEPLENEEKKEILINIEKVRQELHSMISHSGYIGFSDEIVEVSQYLDKLIVAYLGDKESAI